MYECACVCVRVCVYVFMHVCECVGSISIVCPKLEESTRKGACLSGGRVGEVNGACVAMPNMEGGHLIR